MKEITREVTCKITFINEMVINDWKSEEAKRRVAKYIREKDKADHVDVTKIRVFFGKKETTSEVHCKITYIYKLKDDAGEEMLKNAKDPVFKPALAEMIMKAVEADHVEVTKIKDFVSDVKRSRFVFRKMK